MAARDVARGERRLLDERHAVVAAVEDILAIVRREDDDPWRDVREAFIHPYTRVRVYSAGGAPRVHVLGHGPEAHEVTRSRGPAAHPS